MNLSKATGIRIGRQSRLVLKTHHRSTARLQLGRGGVMMGDNASARKSYEEFLNLWKDDPDISILREAKAEYAKLQ